MKKKEVQSSDSEVDLFAPPPTAPVPKKKAKGQPSVDTPTEEEDTRPKVLICGEWRKVPDGYPVDASGQLERDQLFIDDLCKQVVKELRAACHLNPNPGAKPKSGDTKTDLIQACILQLLVAGACFVGRIFLRRLVYQWWSV